MTGNDVVIAALRAAARAEKEQALFYRALSVQAETDAGSPALAERLNGLLADEQHHLSRLMARLLELGAPVSGLEHDDPKPSLAGWEAVARQRERAEIARYIALLELAPDARTATMISEFLAAERRHAEELGGKWMGAQAGTC